MGDNCNISEKSFSSNLQPANDGPIPRAIRCGCVSACPENREALIARPSAFEAPRCHFEVFQADEVMVTSTRHAGGDWRWRLCDQDGIVLVEANGYRTERHCRRAITILQSRAGSAPVSALFHHLGEE
jgi:uncharacterized protein YegP (UPF0339 family)